MKKVWLAALCLFAAADTTRAAAVSGSIIFDSDPAGIFGTWTINYNSTDPDFKLSSVAINVGASGLFLDTQLGNPGATLPFDFTIVSGEGATGFTSISPATAGGREGATSYTLNFNDFGTGESFSYILDVDECNGALNLPCSVVNGSEFAGVTAVLSVTAPGHPVHQFAATFVDRTSTGTPNDAIATFQGEVPEPGTWALIGSALAGVGLLRRRRA